MNSRAHKMEQDAATKTSIPARTLMGSHTVITVAAINMAILMDNQETLDKANSTVHTSQ